jgi:GNAT superfamily N-acetyltransferase
VIVELGSSSDPRFERLLDLAHALFPPAVLEPDAELRDEVDGQSRLPYRYLVWEEQGGVAGFVRFVRLPMDVGFAIHIGVDPERERKGIGKRLLRAAWERMECPVILAEVEAGAPLTWWHKQGAEIVTRRYTQPALRPGGEEVPLNLVAIGPWRSVPHLVERFYEEVWGLPETDAFVQRAVIA